MGDKNPNKQKKKKMVRPATVQPATAPPAVLAETTPVKKKKNHLNTLNHTALEGKKADEKSL